MKRTILTFTFAIAAIIAHAQLPSKAERILALSTIWREATYNFARPEIINGINFDSLYTAFIPKMESAETEADYCRVLSEFTALLRDSHTRIVPSPTMKIDTPPVTLGNFGDTVFVKNVAVSLADEIPLNSVILAIDDMPTKQFLMERIFPTVCASTDSWRMDKAVMAALEGQPDTQVKIRYKTPKGKTRTTTLTRNLKTENPAMVDSVKRPPLYVEFLPDSIAYLNLNSCFNPDSMQFLFRQSLYDLWKAKALIIDVRQNRGGSELAWHLPAFCSIDKEKFSYNGKLVARTNNSNERFKTPTTKSGEKNRNGTNLITVDDFFYRNSVPQNSRFSCPIAVLSGRSTGSAAELFVKVMQDNGITIIGEPTAGALGEPSFIPLPGGYELMLNTKNYITENGQDINNDGILPDLPVAQTFLDHINSRDRQLEAAFEFVKKQIN